MMKVWPPPLSLLYILFINTGGGGEGRRMTSWKGLLLLLGLAFLLFDPTRCVYNHVVCARFLGFFFVFFFFSLVVVYWPSKGGQQHTREPSVCVFIYIKMDNTKEANKKKGKKKLVVAPSAEREKKREEGIYDPPLSPVLSDEREESRFWSRFFRSVDEKKTNSLFLSKKGVLSLFFPLFGNFIAPLRSYWVGVLLSLSLSGFLFSFYWRDEERRARSLKGQHTHTHSSGHLVELLIWQPR